MGLIIFLLALGFVFWTFHIFKKQKETQKQLVSVSNNILADDVVDQSEATALLSLLSSLPPYFLSPLHTKLLIVTRAALADGVLDQNEADEIRVLLGEVLDRKLNQRPPSKPTPNQPRSVPASISTPSPVARKAPTQPKQPVSSASIEPGMEVEMSYEDSAGKVSGREVTVRSTEFKNGRYYLCGICHTRHAYRTFRADRIEYLVVKDTGEFITDVVAALA